MHHNISSVKWLRVRPGLYSYGDWMAVKLKMAWGLCTSWEYAQDKHGLRCSWTGYNGSGHNNDIQYQIRPVKVSFHTIHSLHRAQSCRKSLKGLTELVEALEDGRITPVFSQADLQYLRTQRMEDVPKYLAKWPHSSQLSELLTQELPCL